MKTVLPIITEHIIHHKFSSKITNVTPDKFIDKKKFDSENTITEPFFKKGVII